MFLRWVFVDRRLYLWTVTVGVWVLGFGLARALGGIVTTMLLVPGVDLGPGVGRIPPVMEFTGLHPGCSAGVAWAPAV